MCVFKAATTYLVSGKLVSTWKATMTLQCSNKLQAVCLVKSGSHCPIWCSPAAQRDSRMENNTRKSSSASTLIESKEKEWLDLHSKAQKTDVYDK